jgi:hypothetical protein
VFSRFPCSSLPKFSNCIHMIISSPDISSRS